MSGILFFIFASCEPLTLIPELIQKYCFSRNFKGNFNNNLSCKVRVSVVLPFKSPFKRLQSVYYIDPILMEVRIQELLMCVAPCYPAHENKEKHQYLSTTFCHAVYCKINKILFIFSH